MQFLVAAFTKKGIVYAVDRLSSLDTTTDFNKAQRFETFKEASLFANDCGYGDHVLAISEDTTFSSLNAAAERVNTLRDELLVANMEGGLNRYAEQHVLAANSYLDLARGALQLAWMEQLQNR